MPEQRREFFRVEFPLGYRPRITIMGRTFDVLDISECGIRFQAEDDTAFTVGSQIRGIVRFTDGEELMCSGTILRKDAGSVALQHDIPIPLSRIRAEHLNLIRHFYAKYN